MSNAIPASTTPRTDALMERLNFDGKDANTHCDEALDHGRQLERELATALLSFSEEQQKVGDARNAAADLAIALRSSEDCVSAVMGRLADVAPRLHPQHALYDASGIIEALDLLIARDKARGDYVEGLKRTVETVATYLEGCADPANPDDPDNWVLSPAKALRDALAATSVSVPEVREKNGSVTVSGVVMTSPRTVCGTSLGYGESAISIDTSHEIGLDTERCPHGQRLYLRCVKCEADSENGVGTAPK